MNYNEISDADVLLKIGSKLKELRLEQNIKQKELAEKSGLSTFSISQMETGHNTSMQSLVQVLRALGRMDVLDAFLATTENAQVAERQRVKRDARAPHVSVTYSLPDDDDYAMAAEPDPEF